MIDVSARVIGSKSVCLANAAAHASSDVISGYDYIEIYVAHKEVIASSNSDTYATIATTAPIIIANGGSGTISMFGASSGGNYSFINVDCTTAAINFSTRNYENSVKFACTVVFYKYDS